MLDDTGAFVDLCGEFSGAWVFSGGVERDERLAFL
jgi:hypothetical protein